MTLINAGKDPCAFLLVLKTIIICEKTQARNRFENIKVVCNCVVTRSLVFFGAVAPVTALFYFAVKNESVLRVRSQGSI
jgi:hypothetical protein